MKPRFAAQPGVADLFEAAMAEWLALRCAMLVRFPGSTEAELDRLTGDALRQALGLSEKPLDSVAAKA